MLQPSNLAIRVVFSSYLKVGCALISFQRYVTVESAHIVDFCYDFTYIVEFVHGTIYSKYLYGVFLTQNLYTFVVLFSVIGIYLKRKCSS